MSTRQPLPSTREDGVLRGHNSEVIRWNAKIERNENGRPEEAAGSQRLRRSHDGIIAQKKDTMD